MKRERKYVCPAQKTGYFVFLAILLFVYSLIFWAEQVSGRFYHDYPFASISLLSLLALMEDQALLGLLLLGLYFLMEVALILFFSLATFRKQKWIIPFNIILVIDMVQNLLTWSLITVGINMALIIGANIVVYKLEDAC